MSWDDVLKEVRARKNKKNQSACQVVDSEGHAASKKNTIKKRGVVKKCYYLGELYPGIYLTAREAQCMVCFLQGKTISTTASFLNLSPRTVEFYLKNTKKKLNCQTKVELMSCVLRTDFLDVYELEVC